MIKTSATPAISSRDRFSRAGRHPNCFPVALSRAADGDELVGTPTSHCMTFSVVTPCSSPRRRSASAEQVFDGEALDAGEAVALGAGAVDVEVFEGGAVFQQRRIGFAVGQGWLTKFGNPGGCHGFLYLGVGAERPRLLPQRHVQLHV